MYEIGEQVIVGKGKVTPADEVRFGGGDFWTDQSDDRQWVRIGVMPNSEDGGEESRNVDLAVGDRFEVVGQTWELVEINSSGPMRWGAKLTRIA